MIRVHCLVALTLVSLLMATSIRWKGEGSGDKRESELAEGCPTETRQGPA